MHAPLDQVLVQLAEFGGHGQVLDRGQLARLPVQERIDVELEIVLEQPAERFENAAFQRRVVLLVEEFAAGWRPPS